MTYFIVYFFVFTQSLSVETHSMTLRVITRKLQLHNHKDCAFITLYAFKH